MGILISIHVEKHSHPHHPRIIYARKQGIHISCISFWDILHFPIRSAPPFANAIKMKMTWRGTAAMRTAKCGGNIARCTYKVMALAKECALNSHLEIGILFVAAAPLHADITCGVVHFKTCQPSVSASSFQPGRTPSPLRVIITVKMIKRWRKAVAAAMKQNFPTTEAVNYVFRLKSLLNYKSPAVVLSRLPL